MGDRFEAVRRETVSRNQRRRMSDEVKASDQAALGVMFDDIADKLSSQIERDAETEPISAERAHDFDRFDPSDPRAQQESRRARLQCVIGIRIRRPAASVACACADAVWFRPPADPLGAACADAAGPPALLPSL